MRESHEHRGTTKGAAKGRAAQVTSVGEQERRAQSPQRIAPVRVT